MKNKKQALGAKTAKIVLLFSILLFVILLLTAFVWFPRSGVLPVFKGKWVLFRTISNFIAFFPAFICTIILLSLAVFPGFLQNSTRSFASYAAFLIVTMIFFTGLRELGNPRFQRELQNISYLTRSGEELIEAAFQAEQENDFERAYQNMKRYTEIDPDNVAINRAFDRIKKERATQQTGSAGKAVENLQGEMPESATPTAESLFQEAETYLSNREYNSAYYYATIARQLGNSEAKKIQETAWEKISSVQPGEEIEENSYLFTQKAEGQSSLSYGQVIEAYYLFLDLQSSYPEDREIANLLEETKKALYDQAFFLDEITQALSYPGYSDIFFIDYLEEKEIAFFYASIGVATQEGIFFEDLELITADYSTHAVKEHLIAPYGKGIENTLILNCIHRTDSEIQYRPEYIINRENTPPPLQIHLPVEIDDFQHFSKRKHNTELLSFGELMDLRLLWPEHGYRNEPIYIEILMRLMYPFSFLVFTFFSLSIGIRTKHANESISPMGFLLIPGLPFLLYYIIHFFYYLNRVLVTFVYSWIGFTMALIVVFVFQGILLVFSIGRALKRLQQIN